MKLDVSTIDQERFAVDLRVHPVLGEAYVVTPDKVTTFKMGVHERHLRSLVIRKSDNEVISAGFSKFFNWQECPELDKITLESLSRGNVRFTMKMDGSLIIRSVVDGYVYFRTRGSHDLGPFEEPVMSLIRQEYPSLLDPNLGSGVNLLFEYCAPTNQIVVRYEKPKLWAIGATQWSEAGSLQVLPLHSLLPIAMCVDIVPTMDQLTSPDLIQANLAHFEKQEGYVTWTTLDDGSCLLTKWKTPWYLKLHALRSSASPRFIKEYCLRHGLQTLDEFKERLAEDGFDWEVVSYLEPLFVEFVEHYRQIERTLDNFHLRCTENGVKEAAETDRKTLALKLKELTTQAGQEWLFGYGINLWTGKEETARDIFYAQVLDCGVQEYKNLKSQWAKENK